VLRGVGVDGGGGVLSFMLWSTFHDFESPVELGEQCSHFHLEPLELVNEFFSGDRFLESVSVDRVLADGDRLEVLGGAFGVELLQQGAVLGQVVGDLQSRSILPTERTPQVANDGVGGDLGHVLQPPCHVAEVLNFRTVIGDDAEGPRVGDMFVVTIELEKEKEKG